jgi:hypothetical protein
MKVTITERGWPGHLICADRCCFRRNTLVEFGRRRFVVSTVGAMKVSPSTGYEEIAHNRYFETLVFRAKRNGIYWDANTGQRISLGDSSPAWCLTEPPTFTSDAKADAMHDAIVQEIAKRLQQGKRL